MGDWKVIVPEAGTNEIQNPSFEVNVSDFWSLGQAGASAAITQSSDYQWIGAYSGKLLASDSGDAWIRTDLIAITATQNIAAKAWVRGTGNDPATILIYDDDNTITLASTNSTADTEWQSLEVTWTNTSVATNVRLYLYNTAGDNATEMYFDAVQLQLMTDTVHQTTYIDGDQPGCEWNGEPHNSTSTRSAQSRAGGREYDFEDDYSFRVTEWLGVGATPQAAHISRYPFLPGGQLAGLKQMEREFTLVGFIKGTTQANLHDKRQDLKEILAPQSYPATASGPQPVRIRFEGATVTKEIAAHYVAGLEGNIRPGNRLHEKVAVRFLADDPFWYEIGESMAVLDSNDAPTFRYVGARLKSTGQWDDMGLTANPTTNGTIHAVLYASNGDVYYAGDFVGLDGVAGRDYIAKYTPSTDTWSDVGADSDIDGIVYCLAEGPDGVIYFGGAFVNPPADADADYIAKYTPSTNTIAAVASGGTGTVYGLAFDNSGTLIIVGNFTAWDGDGDQDYITTWTGAAYADLVTGATGTAHITCVAVNSIGDIYFGGPFENWDGEANSDFVAMYDASTGAYVSVLAPDGGAAFNAEVRAILIDKQDRVYFAGDFTNAGDNADADSIVMLDGKNWVSLGKGCTSSGDDVYCLALAPDGLLYAGGNFTEMDDLALSARQAKWNGSSWAHMDVHFAGPPIVHAIAIGAIDPVVSQNYDIYVGHTTTGAGQCAGDTSVTNSGSQPAYPKIKIKRSGGTTVSIRQIRNETTGKVIYLDYSPLDGETLTINLTPQSKSITSDFFGNRIDAMLANSDFGTFCLQPGVNIITNWVYVEGAPTITATMTWRDTYDGVD